MALLHSRLRRPWDMPVNGYFLKSTPGRQIWSTFPTMQSTGCKQHFITPGQHRHVKPTPQKRLSLLTKDGCWLASVAPINEPIFQKNVFVILSAISFQSCIFIFLWNRILRIAHFSKSWTTVDDRSIGIWFAWDKENLYKLAISWKSKQPGNYIYQMAPVN